MTAKATTPTAEALLLETAADLGRTIVEAAIWHEERCNWVGAEPEEGGGGALVMTYRSLGGDLYGGTGGIALFLGELAAATGEDSFRRTALGAMKHALARCGKTPPPLRTALYTGEVGIALAAIRLAALLGEEELRAGGASVLRASLREDSDGAVFDLLNGRAGTVAGLVLLTGLLDDGSLLDEACREADRLVAEAVEADGGLAWLQGHRRRERPLTGLSHGAAGAAYALLELHAVTAVDRYRAAEDAFRYERACFDPAVRNWPDFRDLPGRPADSGSPSFASFWCHGAPGIALTRLRAFELLGDASYGDEAAVAIETTERSIAAGAEAVGGNFSLCHGLGGNAEILLEAGRHDPDRFGTQERLAVDVALRGAEQYGRGRPSWPCGAAGGETPGLFVGLAGIGYFYLRVRDASVPSLLLPRREQLAGEGR